MGRRGNGLASADRLTMERRQAAGKLLAIGGDLRRSWPHEANTLAAEGETKGGWPRLCFKKVHGSAKPEGSG